MKMLRKRTTLILFLLLMSVFVLSTCISNQSEPEQKNESETTSSQSVNTINYTQFAGEAACAECHKEISHNFEHTAHNITSQLSSEAAIRGSFSKGKNSFRYDTNRIVYLEKRNDSFYQVYYFKGDEHVRRRFDVCIGSGTKGQTYLSWVNHQLIELPVSYFTQVHQWANSPGYPLYPTLFNRPATTRCLECHSTFATITTPPFQEPEKYDSTKMIWGITCERCHGPAAQHVAYQKAHRSDTTGKYMIRMAKLSRQQSLDFCSLCHAGRLQKTKPSFTFQAGDTLAKYFAMNGAQSPASNIDVHGNQYGLLAASQCFLKSNTMTCLTCHDVHNNERGKVELFSQRCITCHTQPHKAIAEIGNKQLTKNCIDCHMPVQPSQAINFLLQGQTTPTHATMRTHYITVYDEETKKFIQNSKGLHKQTL